MGVKPRRNAGGTGDRFVESGEGDEKGVLGQRILRQTLRKLVSIHDRHVDIQHTAMSSLHVTAICSAVAPSAAKCASYPAVASDAAVASPPARPSSTTRSRRWRGAGLAGNLRRLHRAEVTNVGICGNQKWVNACPGATQPRRSGERVNRDAQWAGRRVPIGERGSR